MLNQLVLVGRLTKEIQIINDNKAEINIAVPRPFKNKEGIYDTDFINVILYGDTANMAKEYCHKGDLIGIKGRIQSYEDLSIEIIAEKLTFLNANKEEKENE